MTLNRGNPPSEITGCSCSVKVVKLFVSYVPKHTVSLCHCDLDTDQITYLFTHLMQMCMQCLGQSGP